MPKKVAIIYAGAKYFGGVETYLDQLFSESKETELTLISLGEWELSQRFKEKNFRVIVVPFKWFNPFNIFRLKKLLQEKGFDLVVSQGLVANFFGRFGAYCAGIPHLITIHSDYHFDYKGLKRLLFGITFKLFSSKTSHYIAVSNFLKKETEKLGINPEKITVIYNGVRGLPEIKKKPETEIVFGSLGRLHYKKGYHVLVEAVRLLKDKNFKVCVWGEGEERSKLEKMIAVYGLEKKFFLKGFTKDIKKALAETDIYIQPSLEEGFGITVAEAMYAGKPIIVTPAGSLPELITNGKNGFIAQDVSPQAIAKAVERALQAKDLGKMGFEARKEALARFGLEKWVGETEGIFTKSAR